MKKKKETFWRSASVLMIALPVVQRRSKKLPTLALNFAINEVAFVTYTHKTN